MGERRNHVGGALLGLAGLCWVSTVIADGTNTLGWDSLPSVLLLVAGGLCLLGSLWTFGVLGRTQRRSPDPKKLGDACLRLAERIKDFSLDRQEKDPRNHHRHSLPLAEQKKQEEEEMAFWHESGRSFNHRFGADTRRLLEALQDRGLVKAEDLAEMVRLSRIHPDEIDKVAYLLENGAHALQNS